jgi:thiamine pyrophosphate-dependent acetolactate synthase large subunit-like protein
MHASTGRENDRGNGDIRAGRLSPSIIAEVHALHAAATEHGHGRKARHQAREALLAEGDLLRILGFANYDEFVVFVDTANQEEAPEPAPEAEVVEPETDEHERDTSVEADAALDPDMRAVLSEIRTELADLRAALEAERTDIEQIRKAAEEDARLIREQAANDAAALIAEARAEAIAITSDARVTVEGLRRLLDDE